jgi:hypothetical protein
METLKGDAWASLPPSVVFDMNLTSLSTDLTSEVLEIIFTRKVADHGS